eukprot:3612599-Rhodomonas_salina.1
MPVDNAYGPQHDILVKEAGQERLFQAKATSNNARAMKQHVQTYGETEFVVSNDGKGARPLASSDKRISAEPMSTAEMKANPAAAEHQLQQQARAAKEDLLRSTATAAAVATVGAAAAAAVAGSGRIACQVQRGERTWDSGAAKEVGGQAVLAGAVTGAPTSTHRSCTVTHTYTPRAWYLHVACGCSRVSVEASARVSDLRSIVLGARVETGRRMVEG